MNDFTAEMLGLKDILVKAVRGNEMELFISVELKRQIQICPECGTETDRIHDYRTQCVSDMRSQGRRVYLLLRKRRYACPCCNKRFAEQNEFLAKFHRRTKRCIENILKGFQRITSVKQIAEENDVSSTTCWRYFSAIHPRTRSLPTVLSLDEFKGDAEGEKYQSILTNPEKKVILDILPTRYESDLIHYFSQFSTRYSVKYFVIDMNEHFRRVGKLCFPNATIVADRYHVVRQVNWAMENVRKRVQKKLSEKFRKFFKHSRRLMYRNPRLLTDEERNKLSLMFEIAPELGRAYYLRNKFLSVMHSKDSWEGKKKLRTWLYLAEYEDIPEFRMCVTAYTNWAQEILNAIDSPYSNGYTEGCNNKTKVIKRVSFGIRNFNHLRSRILFAA